MKQLIAKHLEEIRSQLPTGVTLVVVSKNQPAEVVLEAYQAGQRVFGENKAQELTTKAPLLPSDIEWHFIGHLQTNKVKAIIPWVSVIHSIDSLKLFKEVAATAQRADKRIRILLQFHIARETTKYGLSLAEAEEMLMDQQILNNPYVQIAGVMGMATFTDDHELVTEEFMLLKEIFRKLRQQFFPNQPTFSEISMGMSDDYPLALAQGSTMIRIGSAIFSSQ